MIFTFVLPGDPVPKGSRTVGVRKNGTRYTREASERVKPWMVAATQTLFVEAENQGRVRFGAMPVSVQATFVFTRPARPAHGHPTRGDTDKLGRALCDALTQSGVISDDRHVVELHCTKRFAREGEQPGVTGMVRPMSMEEG